MGFQDNNEIKIDVVYTKLGRQYKAAGSNLAVPKKVAFSDDGVDYNLYNDNLPDDKQGLLIERTPLLSATTSENSVMKYKLITLPKQVSDSVSTFKLSRTNLTIEADSNRSNQLINNTVNINAGFPTPSGFNITLYDSKYLYIDNPPIMSQRRDMGAGSYGETLLIGDNNNLNKKTQIVKKDGSNIAPANISFDIVYDKKYNTFTGSNNLKTKVIVESIDSGFSQELEVTLTYSS